MSSGGGEPGPGAALERLGELVRRLRAPDGCPWDRRQTPASAAPYILEEAYEAVEAVESGDAAQARGELGDLIFQAVFMANLYEEAGHFTLAEVLEEVRAKMTRRHPHVFGEARAADAAEVKGLWGTIKAEERRAKAEGLLDSVPAAAPALVRAQRLGQRAARVGFDWPDAEAVREKIAEEEAELAEAAGPEGLERELGDVLFAWTQWARHRGLGAEQALRGANARFRRRFRHMEALARERGQDLAGLDPAGLEAMWQEAKAAENGDDPASS
jgi:MazG family protein